MLLKMAKSPKDTRWLTQLNTQPIKYSSYYSKTTTNLMSISKEEKANQLIRITTSMKEFIKRSLPKFTLTFYALLLFTCGKRDKLKMFSFKKLKYLSSMRWKLRIMSK
jgi:hypothetical protein